MAIISEFVADDSAMASAYLRERSDVHTLDQRGTGYSRPALYCPEVNEASRTDGDATVATTACRDRLVGEGVNFGDYNSVNNARDLEEVTEALGYERRNLYGLSYGTRLALTAMRDAPARLNAVVLDSVFPPEINGIAESDCPCYFVMEQIGINCVADADCNTSVPDVRSVISAGVARRDANPLSVDGRTSGEFDETVLPVTADIPTLLVAGIADLATPPAWSMLSAESLPNAQYAQFAGLTHGLIGNNACLNGITRAFLDAPSAIVDQACIVDLPGVYYEVE